MLRFTYILDGNPHTIELGEGSHIIGRSRACDFVIRNPSVSSQHVRVDVRNERVSFRDLLSRNGTAINGAKAETGQVNPGDILKIGQIEMRLEGDAPLPPPPVAVAAAAVPVDSAPMAAPDETPVDQSFLPVPVNEPQGVVQVVRPSEAALPVPVGKRIAGLDRKKVIYAVAGFLTVVLMALLIIPSGPPPKPTTHTRFSYWGTVNDGVAAFEAGEYKKAHAAWTDAHEKLTRLKPSSKNPTAQILAKVGAPFAQAADGKPPRDVDWNELIEDIRDLVDSREPTSEVESFLQTSLLEKCTMAQRQQRSYEDASLLMARGDYDGAIKKFAEIPPGSMYHGGVESSIATCRRKIDEGYRTRALALMSSGDLAGAIAELEKLPPSRRNAKDKENLSKWREDRGLQEDVHRLQRMTNATSASKITDAIREIDRLKAKYGKNPALGDLDGIKDKLQRRLFVSNFENLYKQWNYAGMVEAAKSPYAIDPKVQGLLARAKQIQAEFVAAQKALKDPDDVDGIEQAISHWNAVRRLEPNRDHPANMDAQRQTGLYPPEKRGEICMRKASEAFQQKNYRAARLFLKNGAEKYGMQVTDQVELIKKTGRSLNQQATNAAIDKRITEARLQFRQALSCFLPGERWYEIVEKQIRKYKLDVEAVRFHDIEKKFDERE